MTDDLISSTLTLSRTPDQIKMGKEIPILLHHDGELLDRVTRGSKEPSFNSEAVTQKLCAGTRAMEIHFVENDGVAFTELQSHGWGVTGSITHGELADGPIKHCSFGAGRDDVSHSSWNHIH